MNFLELPLEQAEGALLAHSHKSAGLRIRKGQILTEPLLAKLQDEGVSHVTVAQLDASDVHEDAAATTLATALCGNNSRLGKASTGRVNIHASCNGLLEVCENTINAINRVDESITIATLLPSTRVLTGQITATVKIIPYATSRQHLETVLSLAISPLLVHPGKMATVCLIQSVLPGTKESVLEKTRAVTEQRLQTRDASLISEQRVEHSAAAIAEALIAAQQEQPDWILIFGASATSDRQDVVPTAISISGGQLQHFGMPVDPGNLMVLGELGESRIIGMPGCARSIKHNGVDQVLDRLWCRLPVTSGWITGLGVGGLLQEVVDRPRPRVVAQKETTVAALLLAAGSSHRFGSDNKLLQSWQGKSLVRHTLQTIIDSQLERIVLVTGHEEAEVLDSLQLGSKPDKFESLHNDAHSTGMSSSLIKGISALVDYDAIVVCLADMPRVDASVIDALVKAFKNHPDKALYIPVCAGRRGNPVLITRQLFDSILTLEGDTGARVLAKRFPDAVMEVETNCSGILQDVDTLNDLQLLIE